MTKNTEENRSEFVKELQEKLDWYLTEATEEEYDEQAVESIIYLLSSNLSKEEIPDTADAYEQFCKILQKRVEAGEDKNQNASSKKVLFRRKWSAYAGIAAAVVFVMILAVAGTMQVEAIKESGFFFWLKKDDTGRQMITTSEDLNVSTNITESGVYYSAEELPEWAKEWCALAEKVNLPQQYIPGVYETEEATNLRKVEREYATQNGEETIELGAVEYIPQISHNTEIFDEYEYVDNYEEGEKVIEIYKKVEDSGKVYYKLCYWHNNLQYYIQGNQKLVILRDIASEYWMKTE